jgi:hypothetical protein
MMKKIVYILTVLGLLSTAVVPAFAKNGLVVHPVMVRNATQSAGEMKMTGDASPSGLQGGVKNKLSTDKAQHLQQKANKELTRRIESLQQLTDKINGAKKLSAAEKTTLTQNVQTEITNLTTLQTKIQGDTDLLTLQTDVQSIVKSYRVYALYMPQIQVMVAADRVVTIIDQMTTLHNKLQTRLTDAQTKGKNVTSLQTLLTDMQTKITDAQTQANSVVTTVSGLTPDGYPGNKTTLTSARKTLQAVRLDLVAASQDALKIVQGLHALEKDTSGQPGTPSASLSEAPAASSASK